jgi:hypothetical protein
MPRSISARRAGASRPYGPGAKALVGYNSYSRLPRKRQSPPARRAEGFGRGTDNRSALVSPLESAEPSVGGFPRSEYRSPYGRPRAEASRPYGAGGNQSSGHRAGHNITKRNYHSVEPSGALTRDHIPFMGQAKQPEQGLMGLHNEIHLPEGFHSLNLSQINSISSTMAGSLAAERKLAIRLYYLIRLKSLTLGLSDQSSSLKAFFPSRSKRSSMSRLSFILMQHSEKETPVGVYPRSEDYTARQTQQSHPRPVGPRELNPSGLVRVASVHQDLRST